MASTRVFDEIVDFIFMEEIERSMEYDRFPERFNGFYDNRAIVNFDTIAALEKHKTQIEFTEIFSTIGFQPP